MLKIKINLAIKKDAIMKKESDNNIKNIDVLNYINSKYKLSINASTL